MYQTSTGSHHHRSNREVPLPPGILTVTQHLGQGGYFTCNGEASNTMQRGKMDYNFRMSFEEAFDGTDWGQREPGQPFFAQVHFQETHRDFTPDPDRPIDPDDVVIPPYYPDLPIARLDWALYLETVQNLDKKVGNVLRRLQEESLADDTVVFFWGDHGRPMVRGKQFLYDEGIRIPLIVRWPAHLEPGVREDLVSALDLAPTWMEIAGLRVPGHFHGRSLFQEQPERDSIFAARDRCDGTVDRIRCVRTRRFKYIRNLLPERSYTQFNAYKKLQYPVLTLMEVLRDRGELGPAQMSFMAPQRPEEELYDISIDPHEINNLASDPDSREILTDLRAKLDEWMQDTGDRGGLPEEDSVLSFWQEHMVKWFDETMRSRGMTPDVHGEDYLRWWIGRLEEMKGTKAAD
jgi:uncharacterized sulfatase